jgi:hypothetical protein
METQPSETQPTAASPNGASSERVPGLDDAAASAARIEEITDPAQLAPLTGSVAADEPADASAPGEAGGAGGADAAVDDAAVAALTAAAESAAIATAAVETAASATPEAVATAPDVATAVSTTTTHVAATAQVEATTTTTTVASSVGFFKVEIGSGARPSLSVVLDESQDDGVTPDDQLKLAAEVRSTLRVVQGLFDRHPEHARNHFQQLVAIARTGLTGRIVQPAAALKSLRDLQDEILVEVAARVKTAYMFDLGRPAAAIAGIAAVVALLAPAVSRISWVRVPGGLLTGQQLSNLGILVAGCATGVWLSFGARKPMLTFDDLKVIERDGLGPKTRLAFAILLTIMVALLFAAKILVVDVGSLNTTAVFHDPLVALIVGLLCGFSEQALSRQVATQATKLIK